MTANSKIPNKRKNFVEKETGKMHNLFLTNVNEINDYTETKVTHFFSLISLWYFSSEHSVNWK